MVPVKTQLEHGIRFLDIRVQPVHPTDTSKKDLYLVHGAFPVALTGPKYLAPMLETCYTFLQDHPSETILISLKREGTGPATDEHLSRILETHYFAPNREKWYINTSDSNTIPYLGDVRGKLVLIRRYNHHALSPSPSPSPTPTPTSPAAAQPTIPGLPATSWPHNTPHSPSTPQFPFHLQDFCDIHAPSAISQKLSFSTDHLARANATISPIPGVNTDATNPVPPGALYLNFLSGSNFWSVGCWPGAIAKVVNRGVEEWVCRELGLEGCAAGAGSDGEGNPEVFDIEGGKHPEGIVRKAKMGDGSTGVVVMDHVGEGGDWDLVKLIVGFNMGILNKVGGS
jgi:1-phosphatidylinositol phosphodiesterase